MTQLLHVNASPRGQVSQSLAIADAFLDEYKAKRPELKVDSLHLFEDPLPEFGTAAAGAKIAAFSGQTPTGPQADAWDQARAVFDRFAEADEYVFNVPMWNAGVPYVLKQWIDIVTQPGWAFGFDPATGYVGLLAGKRAVVVYTSGVYAPGVPPAFGNDFHATFFNDWLRFVGITDVTELRLSPSVLTATPDRDFEAALERAGAAAREF
ncbi:FMN-dependent NADH-azoreductase [Krasilnikovia sp. M28-CT-15]|uniref:FMN-dependent NADH-azoreductase n=1 Tax=Krasilnikovia sp. M28-CT-15 TaxID=3373540 RepID=UPI003876F3C9